MLLFLLIIIAIYMAADTASLTLYFLNYPLCRTSEYKGFFKALEYVVHRVASVGFVWVPRRRLSENGLLILGCVSAVGYNLLAQVRDWSLVVGKGGGYKTGGGGGQ